MAHYVVFHCADPMDGADVQAPGSTYYESIDLAEALHPQTILAYALNDEPLPVEKWPVPPARRASDEYCRFSADRIASCDKV
jgi:hypothetical protein